MIRIETPLKLISPNVKLHHMTLHKKQKKMKEVVGCLLNLERTKLPNLPVHVRMTRFCKRQFDWDNYISACKPIRDKIADFIIPGKAPGQADSSIDIYWHYEQEKAEYGIEKLVIEIF